MSKRESADQRKAKDKQKEKETDKTDKVEDKVEKEKLDAKERVKVLESSGILDAYEYLLRQLCKNGLPDTNIFQFSAQQILKYQKKMKVQTQKKQQLFGQNRLGTEDQKPSPNKPSPKQVLVREQKSISKQKPGKK